MAAVASAPSTSHVRARICMSMFITSFLSSDPNPSLITQPTHQVQPIRRSQLAMAKALDHAHSNPATAPGARKAVDGAQRPRRRKRASREVRRRRARLRARIDGTASELVGCIAAENAINEQISRELDALLARVRCRDREIVRIERELVGLRADLRALTPPRSGQACGRPPRPATANG